MRFRLLGPARPTAELASLDRERLAEAKLIGGLPEARKVIQQLHAEVASTRRIKSQYLTNIHAIGGGSAVSSSYHSASTIQLRSGSTSHLSPLTRNLPKSVCVISPCGARDMWYLRSDKLYASFTQRTDLLNLDKGVFVLDFGVTRQSIDEARRDAEHVDAADFLGSEEGGALTSTEESSATGSVGGGLATPIKKEDIAELGSTTHKLVQQQESVWGYCAVAELVLENRTAFVGVCVFCDVVLTAGPARGSRSSAETDAFGMVSDILASGISYAVNNYIIPNPNPAEDIFLPNSMKMEDDVPAPDTTVDEDFETTTMSFQEESSNTIVRAANGATMISTSSISEEEGEDEESLPAINTPTGGESKDILQNVSDSI